MTAPARLSNVRAFLVPGISEHSGDLPGSWLITHGIGKPAQGTYTEVAFGDNALIDPDGLPWPEHIIDSAVREVAVQLYGTAWAFHYRPDQAEAAVHRYGMRRRERVVITEIEAWA